MDTNTTSNAPALRRLSRCAKIGTCNYLYYLRYDQRDTVEPCADSSDFRKDIQGVWFRLPRQEEEGNAPGSFSFCGPNRKGIKP